MPVASDSFRTDGRPWIESWTLHPARAMYSRACALSLAVFDVVRPACMAAASRAAYCSSFAFAVAASEDMDFSNSEPVFTLAAPTAATPPATAAKAAPAIFTLPPITRPTPPRTPIAPEACAIAAVKE